ncbi:MAG: Hsp20/alpha crystallin family protein [Nitrospirae bacterium]|nr:Hsp20/alpha crystallin family protein [Nitrospirota bacterium]
MDFRDLVPWGFGKKRQETEHPLLVMNDLFRNFLSDFGVEPFTRFNPSVNITESDKEIKVSAELPGMDEKDIDVSITQDSLTIKGEKKEEKQEEATGYYHVERSYGAFSRTIPLPCELDHNKIEASFKKGVLVITLPKTAEACKEKRKITIKT